MRLMNCIIKDFVTFTKSFFYTLRINFIVNINVPCKLMETKIKEVPEWQIQLTVWPSMRFEIS